MKKNQSGEIFIIFALLIALFATGTAAVMNHIDGGLPPQWIVNQPDNNVTSEEEHILYQMKNRDCCKEK